MDALMDEQMNPYLDLSAVRHLGFEGTLEIFFAVVSMQRDTDDSR
jgi:hypothetical protein